MLRPATPLAILFFGALVLTILSTLSTPIIKSLPLARFEDIDYGVFGACKGSQCTGIKVGYNPDNLFSTSSADDFTLSESARHSLSSILIVHPVAAFFNLVCFALAIAAHFHSPARSPRYLLALLILIFPTLLITLLAFLVDILLFAPHMQAGGWIVLAAVILIAASGIVTCAMRRTLVSRKAKQKMVDMNPAMSGANVTSFDKSKEGGTTGFVVTETRPDTPKKDSALSATDNNKDYAAAEAPPALVLNPNGSVTGTNMSQRADQSPFRRPSMESQASARSRGGGFNGPPPMYGGRGGYIPRGSPMGRGGPRGGFRGGRGMPMGRGGFSNRTPGQSPHRPMQPSPQYAQPNPSQMSNMPPAYAPFVPEMDGRLAPGRGHQRNGYITSCSIYYLKTDRSRSQYYEDNEPRFQDDMQTSAVPAPLMTSNPGRMPNGPPNNQYLQVGNRSQMSQTPYEIRTGARSPGSVTSRDSHMTSISRRPYNDAMDPGYAMQPPQQQPQQRQMNLDNFGDFSLPGTGLGGRGRGGGPRGRGGFPR